MSTQVVTGEIRLSYANIWEPKASEEGGKLKYSTAILIPKTDKETIKKINAAVEEAKKIGITKCKGWKGRIPAGQNFKTPLRDGDEEKPDDDTYVGHYFFNASSDKKPQIVDRNNNEVMDKESVYSGCFCRVAVNFYPFDTRSNGVAAGLNAIKFLRDGDALGGGRIDVNEAFGDDSDDI